MFNDEVLLNESGSNSKLLETQILVTKAAHKRWGKGTRGSKSKLSSFENEHSRKKE